MWDISRLIDEVWIEIEKAGIPGLCKLCGVLGNAVQKTEFQWSLD